MNKFTKAIAAIMLMMIFTVSCNKPDEPNNGGNNNGQNDTIVDNSGSLNGHDYVDLGLPSGTLWATCNVGADTPEGYGNYFAWGETEPKEIYDWSTYRYSNGDYDQLTKYSVLFHAYGDVYENYGYNGFLDSLRIMQPSDDAATVNWGEGWRTPTEGESRELFHQCSHTWETHDGVNGLLITGTNGNSIFLPAGGVQGVLSGNVGIDEFNQVGHSGQYWTNSIDWDYPYFGSEFYFPYGNDGMSRSERCNGLLVRPVCTVK